MRMRQSHFILSNALIIWGTQVLNLIPQFILVPYLIGRVGENGYGVYALIWPLIMSIDQLMICLQQGVVKYSAGFLAQGRIDEVNRVISSSFIYSILLAIITSAGILVAAVLYDDPAGMIRTALVVAGLMVLLIVPLTPYIAVIQAQQRYYVEAVAGTISKYASLIAIVIWFQFAAPTVGGVLVIMMGMLFLSRLVQVPVAYSLVPGLRNRLKLYDKGSFRLITVFGAATVMLSLCLAVNLTGIRWLMDILASTRFVSHLAIMLTPGLLLFQIIGAMTSTIMPLTSAYEATGNQGVLKELLVRSMRYTTILLAAGSIVSGLLMREFLAFWVGNKYTFLAPYALAWFGSVSFLLSTSSIHHMLKGLGRLRTAVLIYFFGLVVVPIVLILVLFLKQYDPYFTVTAGLVAGNLVCGSLHIVFGMKAVRMSFLELFRRVYARTSVIAATVFLCAFGIVYWGGIDGPLGRLGVAAFFTLLFFGLSYVFIATEMERQQFKEYCRFFISRAGSLRMKR